MGLAPVAHSLLVSLAQTDTPIRLVNREDGVTRAGCNESVF